MKIRMVSVYQYSELNDKAKEKARTWWLSVGDSFAWDNTKEDALQIGLKLTGMDRGRMSGELMFDFSQVLTNILSNHGESCETWATAKEYKTRYDKLTEEELLDGKDEDIREEFLKSILEDYRIYYEKDEEYQQSEECIAETMEANEYEFTGEGKRI